MIGARPVRPAITVLALRTGEVGMVQCLEMGRVSKESCGIVEGQYLAG